ncbi:nucleoprotein TPR-like [Adelges cooleyi]|uniref:nucleoprotein TPR-like n=1 Tax=Adelges cooleyi TaxID=133065 RepID=UPI00217FC657|nr:nucleoprotein TPR-like [Adelges cooleyi]
MDISSLINSILADDGYNALSEDTKSKFQQYLHVPQRMVNHIGINTTIQTNTSEIDFDLLNSSTSIREAKFQELQKEIEVINSQFKNTLRQKHELMLNNESLLKSIHEAETRERMTKMDDGILQLKIKTLNENLLKYTQNLTNLEAKYHKDITELKPELDQKDADVLKLKNDVNLLQIKCKNQEDIIGIMKQEADDLNDNHKNEIDKLKQEFNSSQSLMNHYKECYENEVEQTNKLTKEIVSTKDYVNTLTSSLDDVETKLNKVMNEYEQYKNDTKNTTNILINKLNASEDIVKQLLPVNQDNTNYVINKETTITDVYAIYKDTYNQLQDTIEKLERSELNFKILNQQILDEAPDVDKLEKNLLEANEKIKILCETISRLEVELNNVSSQLRSTNEACELLSKENKRLQYTEDDLSKQVCFLLRNNQSQKRYDNRNTGTDMSPQSIISKNYVTFENIQTLQNQNKNLLDALRSLSSAKDEHEVKQISDLKDKINILEKELDEQTQILLQKDEKIAKLQLLDGMSNKHDEVKHNEVQDKFNVSSDCIDESYSKGNIKNVEDLKHQLSLSNTTIKQLKDKLETNSNARLHLEQHVQELNQQIDELFKKIKDSNRRHCENAQKVSALQNTIASLELKNHEVNTAFEKMKTEYNIVKKENDNLYISNINYSRELRQKAELQKDFEKNLTSQLDSLILNWNSTLAYIMDVGEGKYKDDYKQLTKTLKDVRDNLLSKLEAIDELSSHRESSISRSRTNSLSLCSDERTNFQSVVSKLEHEVKNLRSKLNETGQLNIQLKSELNVTKELYKSLEENLKKMGEYSENLEKERENTKQINLEKDQELVNARKELSEFNLSQKGNINKLQNQLLEYEQNMDKLLEELDATKENNEKLSKEMSKLNNVIRNLEDELKSTNHNKERLEKGLYHKISYYKNKLERLDALELFNKTKSTEIEHLKNQKTSMENTIIEIKKTHENQLKDMDNEINALKEKIERWEFENKFLSDQYKLITNELTNLNSSKVTNKDESLNSSSISSASDLQFTKMTKLINILKDEKNSTILELNETVNECNRLKSELEYKTKLLNDMQIQMEELRGLHASGSSGDFNHAQILEKITFCNQVVERNKILEEENKTILTQLKELQELDEKKTTELTQLKDDMTGMQSLIDQKTAEIASAQKTIARWKERSTGSHSDAEYKQILNTLEREKGKMATALEQLKSMKSDKASLEELLKKQETNHSEEINATKQEIFKLKTKIVSNSKSMESFKNIIKTYRQKFADVASEISKVKILARRYKQLSEELNKTLGTEKISWQAKFDALQQGGSKIPVDLEEREKLIDQGKQEQKTASELVVNELMAKVAEAEANLHAAKSEVEIIKTNSQEKELRAKQLLQQVRNRMLTLSKELETTKKQRDGLMTRLDEAERGGKMQSFQMHISRLELENSKLTADKEQVTAEKVRLSHDIQALNQRVNALMRQFSTQQVKPATSTGPEKQVVEPPTANIKPLGPAVNKPQPVHHSVTVNPWRSAAAETPLASIKPMTMQSRSVVVLPTSQTSSTSSQSSISGTSSSTTIAVHPQQPQSVDISSSGGNALDSSEANSTAQSRHLTSSTVVLHAEGSESAATVSDSNETTAPPAISPLQQVIGNAASPSGTTAQASPAISIALVVPQGREQVQTTVSQTTVSVSTVSPSQSQIDSVQVENGQTMETSSTNNIASSSAPGPLTESEPSVITAGTSGPSCSSLDTTTHSNNSQRKRKADLLVTSYMKRSKSFMPREENRRETEYEAPTSSQRDSEVSNSYTTAESNQQDNKEVDASTDMEVTSEATHENNEVDLASQECTADTNNMNENSDMQNEETEETTGENTPEHSSSNAEATAMAVVEEEDEEEVPETINFEEHQPAPVSSASCEERKNTENVTSDAESRPDESDSTPTEPQGNSSDTNDTVGVSQSTEMVETDVLDLEQEPIEISSDEGEIVEIKSSREIEENETVDIETRVNNPETISVSSSPSKDGETVREESPVAGPSGMTDSTPNERKPITWNESP